MRPLRMAVLGAAYGTLLSGVSPTVALAQRQVDGQSPIQTMTAEDLVKRLSPPPAEFGGEPLTRSVGQRNLVPKPIAVDLSVQFDFDSARLKPDSHALLDALVSAMQHPSLMTKSFAVEGHTDAKGSASYNQTLSERRAQAVTRYLISKGIADNRLHPAGFGFAQLLRPTDPLAPENRRVRVLVLPTGD